MDREEREAEGRVFLLIQHVGDTDVVGDDGGNDTGDATCFGYCLVSVEDTTGEEGEGYGEEEKQGDEADTLAHAYDASWRQCENRRFCQEKGNDKPEVSGDHAPGNEIDSDSRVEFGGVENIRGGVHEGSDDTTTRNKDGCIR